MNNSIYFPVMSIVNSLILSNSKDTHKHTHTYWFTVDLVDK